MIVVVDVVVGGAVDVSAIVVVDADGQRIAVDPSIPRAVYVDDKGGAHVHGAVNDHVDVDVNVNVDVDVGVDVDVDVDVGEDVEATSSTGLTGPRT